MQFIQDLRGEIHTRRPRCNSHKTSAVQFTQDVRDAIYTRRPRCNSHKTSVVQFTLNSHPSLVLKVTSAERRCHLHAATGATDFIIHNVRLVKWRQPESCYNAYTTSASSDKKAFAFRSLLRCCFCLKIL